MTRFDDWRASAGDELCSVTPSGVVADALYPEPEPQTVGPTLGRSAARMAVCMAYDDADVARTGARMHRELAEVAAGTAAPATAWVRLDRAARIGASHRHEDAIHVGKGGVVAVLAEDLAALRGPTGVRVILDAGGNALPVAALAAAAGTAAELAFDPIGAWAVDGMLPASLSNLYDELRELDALWTASTLGYHHAGASPADEIAFAVATLIDMLRWREGEAVPRTCLRVGVTPDLFAEIAKLRALRWVWSRVAVELGAGAVEIHAVASRRTLSRLEPWTNQLRGTTCALAAAVGGADAFTPLAFDAVLGSTSELGRRMARNAGLMVSMESMADYAIDPGRGSGGIEAWTSVLAERAWDGVRAIEGQGGMASALSSGWIRERLDRSHEESLARYRDGLVLVGVNEFRGPTTPSPGEGKDELDIDALALRLPEPDEELELRSKHEVFAAAAAGKSLDDLSSGLVRGVIAGIEPLPRRRLAAELGWEEEP